MLFQFGMGAFYGAKGKRGETGMPCGTENRLPAYCIEENAGNLVEDAVNTLPAKQQKVFKDAVFGLVKSVG